MSSNGNHGLSLVPNTGKRVAELRIQGNSPEAISEILNLKPKDVTARLSEMFGPLGASPMEVNRRIRLAQLDKILNSLWERCKKGELYAIDRALKTIEAAARLEGCYAAKPKGQDDSINPREKLADMLGMGVLELEGAGGATEVTVTERETHFKVSHKPATAPSAEIDITPGGDDEEPC